MKRTVKIILYYSIEKGSIKIEREIDGGRAMEMIANDGVLEIPEIITDYETGHNYKVCSLGPNVFEGMVSIKEIRIPKSIKDIKWSFYQCRNLERIVVDKANRYFADIDGVLYTKDKKTLVYHPSARDEEYEIPKDTLYLGNCSFKCNYKIKSIKCPKSLVQVGINAFYDCLKLENVYDIPEGFKVFMRESRITNHNVTKARFHVGNETLSLQEMCDWYPQ